MASRAARSAAETSPPAAAPRPGDGAHALDAFELGAQLVVVDDSAQLLDARGQRRLAVGVEEELRVGQARADHALVAFDDVHRIGRVHVAHDQEAVRQAAAGRFEQREVLLVQAHRQDQAFLRHLQELFLELAHVDGGMLDQRGDFVQQRGDFRIVAQRGGQAAGVVQQLALDVGAAALERGHDAALVGQRGGIGVGVGYRHRAIAHEAVAQRFAAGGQASAVTGTTSAPCSAIRPWAGRTNLTVVTPSASW